MRSNDRRLSIRRSSNVFVGDAAVEYSDRDQSLRLCHSRREDAGTAINQAVDRSHMLRTGALHADTKRKAFESLERNAKAQAQLVEDLLDVSRVVSGKLHIQTEAVDLAHVIAGALDAIRPAAHAKRVNVNARLDPDMQILVTGDADRLQQIAWNLLANAVKFTPADGSVDVELRQTGASAEVIVADTGQGIAADFLPHVFERFRQADSTVSRKHGGLGLGLALVRHLTDAHGGTVAVESSGEGRGATFRVLLPIRAVAPRAAFEPTIATTTAETKLNGTRVLVVDDEADARDLVSVVLGACGAHVTAVESAGEALHALARQRYDLVLGDIGMPDQDGYTLIGAIRALPPDQGGRVPAVALTAYASLRERQRALEAGYDWHLAKPVDPDELIAMVVTATNSGASSDTLA